MTNAKESQSFTSNQRLLEKKDFQAVFDNANRFGNKCFTVLARENEYNSARLGLAISKKCAKNAVDRNRLKRLFRESFRLHQNKLPNVDMVAMCRSCALDLDNAEIHKQIALQWKHIIKRFNK